MKYFYFQPKGGFNDHLVRILECINYCKKYNRILLIDTTNSAYRINFSDYFQIEDKNVISDKEIITQICKDCKSIYPSCFNNKIIDVLNGTFILKYTHGHGYTYGNKTPFILPNKDMKEDLIIHASCGGGDGFKLFKDIKICDSLKTICRERYNLMNKPYLAIQIRNTDHKCDYKKLYEENKNLIHSYDSVYIATDDGKSLDFFRDKKLNVYNFTTFPSVIEGNLHWDKSIEPHTKISDLISDIYLLTMSDKIISNSKGNFITLVRNCFKNKEDIVKKFSELVK